MGGIGSLRFCVFVLLCIWKDILPCYSGVFHRALVVEKNMLCYNEHMGKKRRSKEFKNSSQVIDMEEARRQRLEKRRAEREKEEIKAKRSAAQKTRGKMAIRRNRNMRRIMVGVVILIIGAVVSASVINVVSLKREQHEAENQRKELEAEKEQLTKELENINDLENLEEQARDQLRLIKKGEKIYIFPEEITENNDDDADTDN